jgi:hypothetical protein
MLVLHRICLFSEDFYSYITLILRTLVFVLFMAIGVRHYVCIIILIFVLTPTDGLYCLVYISCLVLVLVSEDRDKLHRPAVRR